MSHPSHGSLPPSPWVMRFSDLVRAGGSVLDLAAGSGRHTRLFIDRGHAVVAVDRDTAALGNLNGPALSVVTANLEDGSAWPLAGRRFAAVVVTNYLHRPLFPTLVASLEAGGLLIYETFALGNERFGKPSNPDFLLRPGELLDVARGLRVLAFEDLEVSEPKPAMVQRIVARAP